MAKIIKIGSQNLTPNKIANPFKTSRSSTTNPFKYNNFEGTTLPFELSADVFETQKTNKLKMVAASVTGSMNKIRSSIAEPIVAFVNRVRTGMTNAWEYAKSTNFSDLPGIRQTKDFLLAERHLPEIYGLSSRFNTIKEHVVSKIDSVKEIGNEVSEKCKNIVSNISFSSKQRYANMSPSELEAEWIAINAAEGGIV